MNNNYSPFNPLKANFVLAFAAVTILSTFATSQLFAQESSKQPTRNSATRIYRPKVGEMHVDFLLPNIDDRQPLSLSSFRGKKVLLLHFASW